METKELRRELRNMNSLEIKVFGKYKVKKLHNKYVFSFVSDYYDECDYISTVGEKMAIEWILEQ